MAPESRSGSETISILGAGSWGTALAAQLARNGHSVTLWGRDEALLEEVSLTRRNDVYLPGCELPRNLHTQTDLAAAVSACQTLIIAIPCAALGTVCEKAAGEIGPRHQRVILAAKGIDPASEKLAHEIIDEILHPGIPVACLSGPSFADEVVRQLPTAAIVAAEDSGCAEQAARLLCSETFRVYTCDDVIGTSIAGAFKNIIAIAAGISDGLGLGSNARAALITRGLSEIRRLAIAAGGKSDTINGLAGLGDLVLTCTSDQSRNRRFGRLLAEGEGIDQIRKRINQAIEGVSSSAAAQQLAKTHRVNMPICEQVGNILSGGIKPSEAVKELLERPLKPED